METKDVFENIKVIPLSYDYVRTAKKLGWTLETDPDTMKVTLTYDREVTPGIPLVIETDTENLPDDVAIFDYRFDVDEYADRLLREKKVRYYDDARLEAKLVRDILGTLDMAMNRIYAREYRDEMARLQVIQEEDEAVRGIYDVLTENK